MESVDFENCNCSRFWDGVVTENAGLKRISELRERTQTAIEFFKFQKVSKRPIFEKNNRVLPMVFDQKIDILQIPPAGVDFLWFLQKSTLIGTFMIKHGFSFFFTIKFNYFKFQKSVKIKNYSQNYFDSIFLDQIVLL